MKKLNFFANNAVPTGEAATIAETSFATKLTAQLEKQRSKTEVIDKAITIKAIGPVITKDGEVQENRVRIVDTAGVIHWCFKNQLSNERLTSGMKVVVSYRQKGEFINVLSVTADVSSLNAQQLAYMAGNPIVIPAL